MITWIIVAVVLILLLMMMAMYNGLIRLKNRVAESYSDMDVQMKRRYDLIPNLVSTVKGYAAHEQGTFEKVVAARNQAMATSGENVEKKLAAENALSSTLKSLFALAENYPDLKASQNFLDLQNELTDTENKIMASRRFYNGNVRDFNTKLQIFPTNIFGRMLGFTAKKFFQLANDQERQVVDVKF